MADTGETDTMKEVQEKKVESKPAADNKPAVDNIKLESKPSSLSSGSRPTSATSSVSKSPVLKHIDVQKMKEREERLRQTKEKIAEEQKKKMVELRDAARTAQDMREKQQEDRRKRIEEMKKRDLERRAAVEERRKKQVESEKERREMLLKKSNERESKLDEMKRKRGNRESFGFGSCTPRFVAGGLAGRRSLSQQNLSKQSGTDSDSDGNRVLDRRAVSASRTKGANIENPPQSRLKFFSKSTTSLSRKKDLTTGFSSSGSGSSSGAESLVTLTSTSRSKSQDLRKSLPDNVQKTVSRLSSPKTVKIRDNKEKACENSKVKFEVKPLPESVKNTVERLNKAKAAPVENKSKGSPKGPVKAAPVPIVKKATKPESPEKDETPPKEKPITTEPKQQKPTPKPEKTAKPAEKYVVKQTPEHKREIPDSKKSFEESHPPAAAHKEKQDSEKEKSLKEEEYKAKLAEKRRQAREKAEQEAEIERQRQEEIRRQEEEKRQKEEEEHQRMIEEQNRLLEEAKKAEEERLKKAIEEEEERKRKEAEKMEAERKAKEEADKKAQEEAERLEKERQERLQKEEEERQERRRRLEMIMKRVKTDSPTPDSAKIQAEPTTASGASNAASTTSEQEQTKDVPKEELKFRSPLLQNLLGNRSKSDNLNQMANAPENGSNSDQNSDLVKKNIDSLLTGSGDGDDISDKNAQGITNLIENGIKNQEAGDSDLNKDKSASNEKNECDVTAIPKNAEQSDPKDVIYQNIVTDNASSNHDILTNSVISEKDSCPEEVSQKEILLSAVDDKEIDESETVQNNSIVNGSDNKNLLVIDTQQQPNSKPSEHFEEIIDLSKKPVDTVNNLPKTDQTPLIAFEEDSSNKNNTDLLS